MLSKIKRNVYIFSIVGCLFQFNIGNASEKNQPMADKKSDFSYREPNSFVLIELNFFDLLFNSFRLHSEYIAMDGLAFGFSTEYRRERTSSFELDNFLVSTSLTQYLQSLSLKGIFVRGETGLFIGNFRLLDNQMNWLDFRNVGMAAEMIIGYRLGFGKYFSLASGVGLRRNIPDFFASKPTNSGVKYVDNVSLWQYRVDLSLGFSL